LPSNHIPLPAADSSNCALCHANPNDYSVSAMNHVNIASNCAQCHGAGKSFANMAPPTLKLPPSNHIPIGTASCESCHSASNFTTFLISNKSPPMDHAAVTTISCATCHAPGMSWVGTPATVLEPGNHIPIGNTACTNCHSATVFTSFVIPNAVPPMDHTGFTSGCITCHGLGLSWVGTPAVKTLPATHIPTGTIACEGCHSNSSFSSFMFANASGTAPASMVHSLVTSIVCSTCHEKGLSWIGTPPTLVRPALKADGTAHVAAGECSTCHFNTTSFKGATDLPANHIPLPAADSNNCVLCHTTAGNYSLATMNHVNIASNCVQCHGAGKSFANIAPPTLVLPPANHIPFGTAACESCHSATVFTTFVMTNKSPPMNHAVVASSSCQTCHALALTWAGTPATKVVPANHIPIGATACINCHSATNFATFVIANAVPPMNHTGFTTGCVNCHGAGKTDVGTAPKITVTLPANHIPTGTMACEGCHSSSSFNSFSFTNASGTAPPSMVHSMVTAMVCSTCHEKGRSWVGSPSTKVRPALKADGTAHVTAGECSTCHFNTTSFKGATDLPANHIPLPAADSNNCVLCHTTAGNYSLAVMNHVNITTNCAQCHAFGLSFAGTLPPMQPPSGATGHIPSNPPNGTTAIACEQCHTVTIFTSFAGTIMKHASVRAMTCMSCHEIGMKWKTNTGVRLWVRDSANHYAGKDCGGSGCHSARDKFGLRRGTVLANGQKSGTVALAPKLGGASVLGHTVGFNHQRTAGTPCVSCHGPGSGLGKSPDHISSSSSCESCHSTLAWLPVLRVDHLQVSGSCVSCHNAVTARGKGSAHLPASDACQACHTTNAWTPARFDHLAVAAHSCRSCHDGVHAVGMPLSHIPTAAQCDTCHGTLGWKPAKLDHSTLTASCASCHNNFVALGVPPTHLGTQRDCALCHSYPDWSVLHFVHTAATYPGPHKAALVCTACHTGNSDLIPWASPADAGSCGGCHARDFKPDVHPKTSGGLKYTASELRDCTGACHVYSDATSGTIVKARPGPQHRVSDAAFKR
ncbi:MAG TPA: cytochrome c3 family protein, partial [Steroidobacteraceae bacterium]|nr:cytochrome c3 family protein [Steroidobacteraceae bacterium]